MRHLSITGAVLGLLVAASSSAVAAPARQPGLFQGFSGNSDQPISITSENLEADQAEQKVVFTGNVVATQGESVLRSRKLTVFYNDTSDKAAAQATPSEQGRSIKRLEAEGEVVVTSADQKAQGDAGVFDMAKNTASLTGNVVLTQGQNVVRGKRLNANLDTNVVRLTGGVHAHFVQEQQGKPSRAKRKQGRRAPLS